MLITLRSIVLLQVVLLPLVASPFSQDQFDLPKECFALISSFFLILLTVCLRSPTDALRGWRRLGHHSQNLLWVLIGFNLLALASALWSPGVGLTLRSFLDVVTFSALGIALLLFLDLKTVQRAFMFNTVVAAFSGGYCAAQSFGLDPLLVGFTGEEGRFNISALVGSSNECGVYLAISLVAAQALWPTTSKRTIWLLAPCSALILIGLLLTQSLAAYLGAAVGLSALGYLWLREFWLRQLRTDSVDRRKLALGAGVLLLFVALTVVVVTVVPAISTRLSSRLEPLRQRDWEAASGGRYLTSLATWDLLAKRPWLGHGLGSFQNTFFSQRVAYQRRENVRFVDPRVYRQAHNEPLQVLAELGLLGFLALAVFALMIARAAWRTLRMFHTASGLAPDQRRGAYCALAAATSCLLGLIPIALLFFPLHLALTSFWLVLLTAIVVRSAEGWKTYGPRAKGAAPLALAAALAVALVLALPALNQYRASVQIKEAETVLERVLTGQIPLRLQAVYLSAAEHRIRKAIELNPYDDNGHTMLGTIHLLRQDFQRALDNYRIALQLAPSSGIYVNIGTVYLAMKDYPNAERCFALALEHSTYFPKAETGLAQVRQLMQQQNNKP